MNAFQIHTRRIVLGHLQQSQLGVAADRSQQVVEVVRNAAREAADRFHLLRLQKLFLEDLLFGDVACVDHNAANDRVVEQVSRNEFRFAPLAGAGTDPGERRHRNVGRTQNVPERLPQPPLIVGMKKLKNASPFTFLRRVPEVALDRRARVTNRAVGVEDGDRIRGVLDEAAEVPLALTDLLLVSIPARRVARDADEPGELAEFVPCGRNRFFRPVAITIRSLTPTLQVHPLFGR